VKRTRKPAPVTDDEIADLQPEWRLVRSARPMTRADCADIPRPCPFVGCKYHLYLDVMPSGHIHYNFPDKEPEELEWSCALDVAGAGEHTLEEIGLTLDITRERVRQIEAQGLEHARCERASGTLRAFYGHGGGSRKRTPRAYSGLYPHMPRALLETANNGTCALPGCNNPVRVKERNGTPGRPYAYCEEHATIRARREFFRARMPSRGRRRPAKALDK